MKKRLIAGNWKMNNTVPEALKLVTAVSRGVKEISGNVEVVVIPPFTSLYSVGVFIQEFDWMSLGAQDMFWEDSGPYTGEISGALLKDVGCSYVVVGHSERRAIFGETDEAINKKVMAALRNELIPIICVGETLEERERGRHFEVVEQQLKKCLFGLSSKEASGVVIAYEPVWAIGTGKNASAKDAEDMHHFMRNLLEKVFDAPTAADIRIIYGGSVKKGNVSSIMSGKNVDGVLVGGASLNGEEFVGIIDTVCSM